MPPDHATVTALFKPLAARQAASLAPQRGRLSKPQLRKVTDYIEARLAENIALTTLAELTGLSQSHFARAFKASTGMPPHRWQLAARVRRAQILLIDARIPLSQVASETGFADQSHFTRVFGRMIGTTPWAWRRERIQLPAATAATAAES